MKKLLLMIAIIAVALGAAAQNRTAKGRVVFAGDGDPLVGASVNAGGMKVATDADGRFSITVPASVKQITVSYVGMKTAQFDITSGDMEIELNSTSTDLDEIVVTALGMKKDRKRLGYAVQDLKGEELNTEGTTSLASAMQGKVTGVDIRPSSGAPGASAQIVIRGARSFDGNNAPLYVVDGMPIETTPDFDTGNSVTDADIATRSIDINPEDIESINILKGQAASALYGIRASNGVIVITTKRGALNSSRPVITVSTNLSAERVSRKFHRQEVYAQGNSIDAYNPSSSMSWGPKISDLPNDATYGGNGKGHDGMYYNPKYAAAYGDEAAGWVTPTIHDNVGDFFNTGFTENTSFNISQRTEQASYSFSVNNSHQDGIVPSTGLNRWGARGLVDWNVNKYWKAGFSANYNSTKVNAAPGANSGIMNVVYSAPAEYDLKGTPYCTPDDPTYQISFRSTNFNNPYWWAANNAYKQHTNRFFGNAYAEFSPNLGRDDMSLTFREQAGMDMWTSDYSDVAEVGSASNANGEISNYGSQRNVFNNLFTAAYNFKFGADREWDFDALLGNEINQDNDRRWSYYGGNFNFYGMPTIGNATNFVSSEFHRRYRTVGFFGSLSLSWNNELFLTVTGRNDYVSSMPRNNRSFFYPSVSLGWVFTERPELKNNKVLSFGKLRASFAQVGQAGTYYNNYYYTPTYGSGMYSYNPVTYPILGGISTYVPYYVFYDPNLKPQNTTNFEIGADLRFFNNRLGIDYTASYQNVTDQIFAVPMSGSTGYQYLMTNAGKMKTWSHELTLDIAILQNKDYDLNLGVNFTAVNNKVVELAEGVESIMLGGFVEPQIRAQAGNTYPNIYGTAFKRDDKGNLLLLDGLPQGTADSEDLGNCSPDFVTGINLGGRYKRVSVATTWSWQKGGRMYHGTNMTLEGFGVTKESIPYHEGTMIAEGIDEATGLPNTIEVDKADYYQAYFDVTESGIYDMSFLKLRDVTLTYKLPRFAGIDMSIFGFARNVLVWAKMPNFDPESSQGNNNMGGYFERYSIPNTSSYGGGVKITF
ncbi:MAG: SusC/RagA family TonB-linked outer membrane protein [Muribaculaceae bacterium]|nr:SusC/RagA family TonB-linked outer membrane protein [Muribaculaceae bacterium]